MGLEEDVGGGEESFWNWMDFIFTPSSFIRALADTSRQGVFRGSIGDRIAEPICYGLGLFAEIERLAIYFRGGIYIAEKIINW